MVSRISTLAPPERGQVLAMAIAALRSAAWTIQYPVALLAAVPPSVLRSPSGAPGSTRFLPSVPNQAIQAAMTFSPSASLFGISPPMYRYKNFFMDFTVFPPRGILPGDRLLNVSKVYEPGREWADTMPEQASVGPGVRPFARSEIHVLSCPIQASLGVL